MNRKRYSLLFMFLMVMAGYAFAADTASGQDTEIIFFTGAQTTTTLTDMITDYNDNFAPTGVTVTLQESTWETNSQYDTYASRFAAGDDTFDVISMDVIWPPSFVVNDWLEPLDDILPSADKSLFFEAPILAGTYDGKQYGVPWFHDLGLLYYRTDIIEYAFDEGIISANRAPQDWAELHDWTIAMLGDADLVDEFSGDLSLKGFVWQGKAYEGLMCDFMEYLGGTGQTSWLTDNGDGTFTANLDTDEVVETLEFMKSLIDDGVSPEAVLTYTEESSREIWHSGNAIFHRNWPYAYRLGLESEALNGTDAGTGEKIFAVAPMPPKTAGDADARTGCLGGWQLGLNAFSNNKDDSKEFIEWITAEEQQLTYLEGNGALPTRISAYDKAKISDDLEYVVDFLDAFKKALPRPVHPNYPEMSQELWEPINSAVAGSITAEDAAADMNAEVEEILNPDVEEAPFPAFFALIALGTMALIVRRRKK